MCYNAVFSGIFVSIVILAAAPVITPFLFRLSGAEGTAMDLGTVYLIHRLIRSPLFESSRFRSSKLIGLFNSDPDVIRAGTVYLRIEFIAFPTYVILNILISVLQGSKRPNFAVFIGLYRQIVLPLVLFRYLGSALGMGITGVWWGVVAINWSAVIITWLYNRAVLSKILTADSEPVASQQ